MVHGPVLQITLTQPVKKWNPNIYHCTQKSLLLNHIHKQLNPGYTFTPSHCWN